MRHNHSAVPNGPECFSTSIGCIVKGTLVRAVHNSMNDSGPGATIVFECGWGLAIHDSSGGYWTVTPAGIAKTLKETKVELRATMRKLEKVVALTGKKG